MEAPVEQYVNGAVEEQTAPQTLQELQAAVQDVHAMPVVVGAFQEALGAAADAQGGGTPADQGGLTGDDGTPGMHLISLSGRGRMSSGSFKNRLGPMFCQVEGCGMPLENLKEYHQRYKVCEEHLKIPFIVRDGQQVRFCQQCGRFQPLEDFDDQKRSCRVRLQRHNARRRKRPRDGNSSDHHGGLVDYGAGGISAAAAAEMAKLAYAPAGIPLAPKEIQAMQDALHFASTTLMHSNQVVTGKPAGEEGEEGGEGMVGAMGPNSMPFVPTPEVMMLLLKGYAAMFHYVLDDASVRALAPPSDLPSDQQAASTLGLGAIDALQMQQLMQAQGFLGGATNIPLLLAGGEQGAAAAAAAAAGLQLPEAQHLVVPGAEGGEQAAGHEQGAEGGEQDVAAHEQQQHEQQAAAAAAALEQQQQEHTAALAAAAMAAADTGELTAEQVAAALIHPMPTDAAAAAANEGAVAAAAALAAAAGGHMPAVSAAYMSAAQAGQMDAGQMDASAMDAAAMAAATLVAQQPGVQPVHEDPAAAAAAAALEQQQQQQQAVAMEVPPDGTAPMQE